MKSDDLAALALLPLMLAVGALGWWFQLRPELSVEPSRLATLPFEIEAWQGQGVPLADTVERILDADFNLQRAYQRLDSDAPVWLYIGYYGTHRGGRPEHKPSACYPAAGWQIVTERTVELDAESDLRATEYVVEQQGEQRLVYYWFRSGQRTGMLDTLSVSLDQLRGRLRDGRADGALVRVSTPIDAEGEAAARLRLANFARQIDPLIAERWPVEFPSG